MRRAAHPAGCARCGAGAGCLAIEYQSLMLDPFVQATEEGGVATSLDGTVAPEVGVPTLKLIKFSFGPN